MTTIAYKDGVIAYDSRETMGSTIYSDDCDKCIEVGEFKFFSCGSTPDIRNMIDLFFEVECKFGTIDSSAIVTHFDKLMYIGWNQTDGVWRSDLDPNIAFAIGSGSPHALTAMDFGLSAYQAVETAIKRDTGSGGRVRTFTVGT